MLFWPKQAGHRKQETTLKRAMMWKKNENKIEEGIACGKMKGVLTFNIYSVNLKFVCSRSQTDLTMYECETI